jgi:hypothetical protein
VTSSHSFTRPHYLSLVSDEVDFRFAGLRGGGGGNVDLGGVFGLLNQNVDQSLLFVLGLERNNGSGGSWGAWGLDEDDLVVLLGLSHLDGSLGPELFRLWWWYVHVDVLLDGGASAEAAAESASESAAAAGTCNDRSDTLAHLRRDLPPPKPPPPPPPKPPPAPPPKPPPNPPPKPPPAQN